MLPFWAKHILPNDLWIKRPNIFFSLLLLSFRLEKHRWCCSKKKGKKTNFFSILATDIAKLLLIYPILNSKSKSIFDILHLFWNDLSFILQSIRFHKDRKKNRYTYSNWEDIFGEEISLDELYLYIDIFGWIIVPGSSRCFTNNTIIHLNTHTPTQTHIHQPTNQTMYRHNAILTITISLKAFWIFIWKLKWKSS